MSDNLPDIRLKVDFVAHRKTRKMVEKYGSTFLEFWLEVLFFTRLFYPKGILRGMGPKDILRAGKYIDDIEIINDLIKERFIDCRRISKTKKVFYSVHDWKKHNPFAYFSEERSKQARKAVIQRWKNHRKRNTDRNTGRNTERNAPIPNTPIVLGSDKSSSKKMKNLSSKTQSLLKILEKLKRKKPKLTVREVDILNRYRYDRRCMPRADREIIIEDMDNFMNTKPDEGPDFETKFKQENP